MVRSPYYASFLTMPIIVSDTYALHALFMLLLLYSKDLFLSLYNFFLLRKLAKHLYLCVYYFSFYCRQNYYFLCNTYRKDLLATVYN
jgi:hypothetical protein